MTRTRFPDSDADATVTRRVVTAGTLGEVVRRGVVNERDAKDGREAGEREEKSWGETNAEDILQADVE